MTVNVRGTCRCGAYWTGATRAHCGGCHKTFSTVGNFDRHRSVAAGPHGACLDPLERGLVVRQMVYGVLYGAPAVDLPPDARQGRQTTSGGPEHGAASG